MSDDADFTFGGKSITDELAAQGFKFWITDIQGEGLIGSDLHVANRPGGEGGRWVDENTPARTVTVSYHLEIAQTASHAALTAQSDAEVLLNGLLHSRRPRQLQFSHQRGYFMAALAGLGKSDNRAHRHRGQITFTCPNPYRLGDEVTVSPDTNGQLAVATNRYVEPVILWTTDAQVGAAWIEIDGERLTIDTGISAGQQIRIDAARKEVRVGGVLNVENIHGTFPQIEDGSVVETSPGGEISFTYQERWL